MDDEEAGTSHNGDRPLLDDSSSLELDEQQRAASASQRRLDAKRKRIRMLNELLRELDMMAYLQLIVLYYLDCSFFWFFVRAFVHFSLLTPPSSAALERLPDEPRPFLPVLFSITSVSFLLHALYPAPSAGEDTRGYLHGGILIDFIGQKGPSSKWKLAALDICVILLQLVMVSVHVKRRELKKELGKTPAVAATTRTSDNTAAVAPSEDNTSDDAERTQDIDSEERGLLRRSDTLSDAGADPGDENVLLSSSSAAGPVDTLDTLIAGQAVIGHFGIVYTVVEEHRQYSTHRQTRSNQSLNDVPETLRRLNMLRTRFGVGAI